MITSSGDWCLPYQVYLLPEDIWFFDDLNDVPYCRAANELAEDRARRVMEFLEQLHHDKSWVVGIVHPGTCQEVLDACTSVLTLPEAMSQAIICELPPRGSRLLLTKPTGALPANLVLRSQDKHKIYEHYGAWLAMAILCLRQLDSDFQSKHATRLREIIAHPERWLKLLSCLNELVNDADGFAPATLIDVNLFLGVKS